MPASVESVRHVARDVVQHSVLQITTRRATEFVDVTARLQELVAASGVAHGMLMVQSRHTTAGILINEHERLLLQDLEELFERLAPASRPYRHDDFAHRPEIVDAGERVNGHAHCRAALLRTSECVGVSNGALSLGRWQRVFFVDFDGGQRRELWVTILGQTRASRPIA
jgi:secondary thiamine-phosphate synthase enzyme